MTPEKPRKGHLRGLFNKAFITGLAAMTLVTGVGTAYAQQPDDWQTTAPSMSDAGPQQAWQQNPDYLRELGVLDRYYGARADEIKARDNEQRLQRIAYEERNAMNSNRFIGVRLNGVPILGSVFNSAVQNGYVTSGINREHARAASDLASLERQYLREKMSLENNYQRIYESRHPTARVASAGALKTFAQQQREVCERRALNELSSGRILPNGDPCRTILDGTPKL